MKPPFLLTRILLDFHTESEDMHGELSAIAQTPDGSLWVGSDEMQSVERLSPTGTYIYGEHKSFHLQNFVDLFRDKGEVDIEGMDYSDGYLWLTGSHSVKRKKTKGKKATKDLDRLATVYPELNRYLLARIPVFEGSLLQTYTASDKPESPRRAGTLQKDDDQNVLLEALSNDPHLAPYLTIPNKENGLDVEGLAVRGNRIFLGLRGPVLRGWAILLEIEVEEQEAGVLSLKPIGSSGQYYQKHMLDLSGLGIRELCIHGDDLIILAGPTMDLEGAMEVFRLHQALELEEESVTSQESDRLEPLFYLPFTIGSDHAEGLELFPCLGEEGLLMVYDSPDQQRQAAPDAVFADVFRLDR